MDKEKAITKAIEAAVESFIADDIEEADHFFEMAEEFTRANEELFGDDPTPTTQGAAQ